MVLLFPSASSLSRTEKFSACMLLEEEEEEVEVVCVRRERLRRRTEG